MYDEVKEFEEKYDEVKDDDEVKDEEKYGDDEEKKIEEEYKEKLIVNFFDTMILVEDPNHPSMSTWVRVGDFLHDES